jgi:hypothetical protein
MPCVSCGSRNKAEFPAEVNIHCPAVANPVGGQPGMLVFPKLLVCLDCGFSTFHASVPELALLTRGALNR